MTFKKLFLMAMGISAWSTDISGKWIVKAKGIDGARLDLVQSREQLTGSWIGATGKSPITGSVQTDSVEFRFRHERNGESVEAWFEGTIEGQNEMEGTYRFGSSRPLPWNARRTK